MVADECRFDGRIRNLRWRIDASEACTSGLAPISSAAMTLAIYTSISVLCQLPFSFKHYNGLYFWSILATSLSACVHAILQSLLYIDGPKAFVVKYFFYELGWVGMIVGFSMVLYSRLYLLDQTRRWRVLVLTSIMVVAVFNIVFPVLLTFYRDNGARPRWIYIAGGIYLRADPILVGLQEGFIVFLYLRAAWSFKEGNGWVNKRLNMLVGVQIAVLALDIVLIGFALALYFALTDVVYAAVYAVKLNLEFVALNQLVALSGAGRTRRLVHDGPQMLCMNGIPADEMHDTGGAKV